MSFDVITKFLNWLGGAVLSTVTLPASWAWVGNALPLWVFGLVVVVVLLLVFKIVTHFVFKVLMWLALIVGVLLFLSSLGVPVWQWVGAVKW